MALLIDCFSYDLEVHLQMQAKEVHCRTFDLSLRVTVLSADPCKNISCDNYAKCSALPNDTAVCQCEDDCTPEPVKPVCGSDMVTYASECALKAKACVEKKMTLVKSRGICRKCLRRLSVLKLCLSRNNIVFLYMLSLIASLN